MKRLFKGRKGQTFAPIMTVGLAFFNILYYIILVSFAQDSIHSENIGSTQNIESINTQINTTETSASVSYADRSWISKFFITVYDMPWWINVFTVVFQATVITVIILAWVRGL